MAGRGGWGRGRGRGVYVRPVPFVVFPQDIDLPDVKHGKMDTSMRQLLKWDYDFDRYFEVAPYFLEEKAELKGRKRMHVERFSDKKKTIFTRDSLLQVLVFDECVKELVPGKTKQTLSRKKRQWNPEYGEKKLALLEKELLEEHKEGKHKKEEEDEESEDEEENEESSESGNDDYDKNDDVDDDDLNDKDSGDDEAIL
ncbi:putative DNA-directed RNA polymerase III, subunit Rpc31 [Medicago truncatula]|uniref:Putative DNA-directed RNA polymerase III, subunit Rpc31 n=1 Tax=Medicago truncatula TaxID=3880 RepID=A0A396IQ09_MEDTR|nr:DNA-directed RNA polymerase III subunit RPC7-like [Medicago truncatula]RHN65985.1 putative DNA-directed RNA polymerase III, subunit Rpc31 [Medicago truncatula]